MRHTRNRQMIKASNYKSFAVWNWKGEKNHTIKFARTEAIKGKELDPTFKWNRECYPWGHNYVEFEKEVPVPPGRIEKRAILRRVK